MTVNGDLVGEYIEIVSVAMVAFLPLLSSVIGIFLAFAIANLVRHMIMRMK